MLSRFMPLRITPIIAGTNERVSDVAAAAEEAGAADRRPPRSRQTLPSSPNVGEPAFSRPEVTIAATPASSPLST